MGLKMKQYRQKENRITSQANRKWCDSTKNTSKRSQKQNDMNMIKMAFLKRNRFNHLNLLKGSMVKPDCSSI